MPDVKVPFNLTSPPNGGPREPYSPPQEPDPNRRTQPTNSKDLPLFTGDEGGAKT